MTNKNKILIVDFIIMCECSKNYRINIEPDYNLFRFHVIVAVTYYIIVAEVSFSSRGGNW